MLLASLIELWLQCIVRLSHDWANLQMVKRLRVVHCLFCGHKLRFGAGRCSVCGAKTQLRNRYATWLVPIGIGLISTVLIIY